MNIYASRSVAALLLVALVACATTNAPRVDSVSTPDFSPANFPKLAVIVEKPTRYSNISEGSFTQLEDSFQTGLLRKGYQVASRSDLRNVLQEIQLSNSGLTDASDAQQLGKQLNVPAILVVKFTNLAVNQRQGDILRGETANMMSDVHADVSARLIGVETGEVLWTGNISHQASVAVGSEGSVLRDLVQPLVDAVPARTG